jgi:hypothetical protein
MVMREITKLICTVIIFIAATAGSVSAQKFTASADLTDIAVGDIIHLTYTLEGGEGSGFIPPALDGIRVLQGPEVSNQFNIINGQSSASVSYTYLLQAIKKGKIIIPPAHVNFKGKLLASNKITIKVYDSNSPEKSVSKNQKTESLFLKAEANKTSMVQGEAIAVSYKLFVSNNVRMGSPTVTKMPTFTGFWAETGNPDKQLQQTTENYKGKIYSVYLIRKLILFPQKTGSLTVDPLEIECTGQIVQPMQVNPNDPFSDMFDNMFNMTAVPFHKVIISNPVVVNVSALPDQNKPVSFTGMVGKAAIAASSGQTTVKANEPVTFHLTIGGEGNLSLQQAPRLNLPSDIELYEPKITDKFDRTGDNLTGTRTFDYTLMPHKEGKFEIPAISFSYYDPLKKQYFESKTVALTLNVEKNDKAPESKNEADAKTNKGMPEYLKWIILMSGSLLLLFAVLLFIRKRVKPLIPNAGDIFAIEEEDNYNKYMDQASHLVFLDARNEFYSLILNTLYNFMEHLLDKPFSEITHETIRTGLQQKQIPEEQISEYLSLINECEMINYAPAGFSANKELILKQCQELIEKISAQNHPE